MSREEPKIDKRKTGDHLWQAGISGNPNGKPKGTMHKPTLWRIMLAEGAEDVIKAVIRDACKGNPISQKLVLERLIPLARDSVVLPQVLEALKNGLSQGGTEAINAVANGEIAPEQGQSILSALHSQAQLNQHTDMVDMLEKVKQKVDTL